MDKSFRSLLVIWELSIIKSILVFNLNSNNWNYFESILGFLLLLYTRIIVEGVDFCKIGDAIETVKEMNLDSKVELKLDRSKVYDIQGI